MEYVILIILAIATTLEVSFRLRRRVRLYQEKRSARPRPGRRVEPVIRANKRAHRALAVDVEEIARHEPMFATIGHDYREPVVEPMKKAEFQPQATLLDTVPAARLAIAFSKPIDYSPFDEPTYLRRQAQKQLPAPVAAQEEVAPVVETLEKVELTTRRVRPKRTTTPPIRRAAPKASAPAAPVSRPKVEVL